MEIGMIGLGHMGGAMALRMIKAGHKVVGYDTSLEAMRKHEAAGGSLAQDPREVADQATVVLSCLSSKEASFDTAFGSCGAIHGGRIHTYVEMSTLGRDGVVKIGQALSPAGIDFLDAPISGGPRGAAEGRLTAILAGSQNSIKAARPVLDIVASNVFIIGPEPGMAQVCKLVNNILSITAMAATCEAVSIGVKAGLDARAMIDVINVSTGRNSATMDKFPKSILPRTFDYGGPIAIGLKDIALYLELAHEMRMPASVGTTLSGMFNQIASRLGTGTDYSAMIKFFEEGGDVVVGDKPVTPSAA